MLKQKKKTLIVVVGPTAVGKTAVAIQLAQFFKTAIISADSRQIFRETNIGTAKPSSSECALVPHHFINSHSINENYDAAQFARDALARINELFRTHDYVIMCGGSGLYVKSVCEGFDDIPEVPEEIRREIQLHYGQHGLAWLQDKMKAMDPGHFNNIDQQNPQRLMRALEVKIGTGKSISSFRGKAKLDHDFEIIKIGLYLDRDDLYKRINDRIDKMIADGLFEEAEKLYPFRNMNALQTVGYQEIFDFMDGQYNREEAIRLLKRNSRRYAKRQLTWFKRDTSVTWFRPGEIEAIKNKLVAFDTEHFDN